MNTVWTLLGLCLFNISEARLTLSLDGSWDFALDPASPTTRGLAATGRKVAGAINVPGAWNAQGYGEEIETLKHHYMGVATYTRKVPVPTAFADTSKMRLFLVAERIERSAKLFVGNTFICEHTGYLSNLDCEVSVAARGKPELEIRIVVNSTRATGFDGLVGEQDLDTDGTNLGGWGGLGGHVRLEARSKQGWIMDPWIRHTVADSFKSASVNASVTIGTNGTNGLLLKVAFVDYQNRTVSSAKAVCGPTGCSTADVEVTSPMLWSPRSTVQYEAVLELVSASGEVVDKQVVKFGFRRLDVVGYHWKLNGVWLYLHGYGDDSIYPATLAPPLDHNLYTSRLTFARSLGMNWVRHHSHILPDEYFEAACEVGIMVSAEFPLAYGAAMNECPGTGCDSFYEEQWAAIIRRLRNRPCLFDYTMNNEDIRQHNAKKLYHIAKTLDPTRPVNTADGVWPVNTTAPLENPEDFRPVGFELQKIPIGFPHQFRLDGTPPVPVINHEMGNFVSWPQFDLQISRFQDTLKPYWLTPAREHLQKLGLMAENELWSYCSRQLYLFCWKNKMEALRKTEKISGYEWWLVQDFWMGSNGIVDTYFVSKHPPEELDVIRRINGAVLLLIAETGDNLPLSDTEPRLQRAYSSKETLSTSLHVSNQGAKDIVGATLYWRVTGLNADKSEVILCSGNSTAPSIAQGPGTPKIVDIKCTLPDLGNFVQSPRPPMTLLLGVQLQDVDGGDLAENQWRSRVYATAADGPSPKGRQVYTMAKYCQLVPISNMDCSIPPVGTKLSSGSVIIVDYYDEAILGFASAGATVLMLKGAEPAPFGGLPTDPANFKTAWWLGSATDNNMGTVVYNTSSPFTVGMTPEPWADEGWFNLVQDGQNFVLEGSIAANVDVLIRSIDLMGAAQPVASLQDNPYKTLARSKALVWQAGIVPSGASVADIGKGGAIIASGLNLLVNPFHMRECSARGIGGRSSRFNSGCLDVGMNIQATDAPHPVKVPEAAWLLHQLLEYAYSGPKPSKVLEAKITQCPDCMPSSTWTLCPASDVAETFV